MEIPLKKLLSGSRQYLIPTVMILLSLGGAWKLLLSEHSKLLDERRAAMERELNIYRAELELEYKQRTATAEREVESEEIRRSRSAVENELDALRIQTGALEKAILDAERLKSQYGREFAALEEARRVVGEQERLIRAEEEIQRLMTEFRQLGVDLSDDLDCSDRDELRTYNQAAAMRNQIIALAQRYRLEEDYRHFIFKSGSLRMKLCHPRPEPGMSEASIASAQPLDSR